MKVYALVHEFHGNTASFEEIVLVSTNKKLVFYKAAQSSKKEEERKGLFLSTYWIHIFNNATGKKLDEIEFVSDRHEKTFGKIVRERGSCDEKIVGTWVE